MTTKPKSAFIVARRTLQPGDVLRISSSIPPGLYDVVALRRQRISKTRAHIDLDLTTRDQLKDMAKSMGTTYDRLVRALITIGELNTELLSMVV